MCLNLGFFLWKGKFVVQFCCVKLSSFPNLFHTCRKGLEAIALWLLLFCANTDFLQIWDSAENNHIYQEQPVSSTLAICRPCECPACQIGEFFSFFCFYNVFNVLQEASLCSRTKLKPLRLVLAGIFWVT